MISAKIIADSKNSFGQRITTMVVTFPRIVLAEFNTHRMFSRNSASSRAIPFLKMVQMVQENPFIPVAWQIEHRGMQGTEYHSDIASKQSEQEWLIAKEYAVLMAKQLSARENTKQICNRLLEPFMWHTAIITATEFENFFQLRCPQYDYLGVSYRSKKDLIRDTNATLPIENTLTWLQHNKGQAEIHISLLAEAMWDAMNESTPKELKAGEWHIPFGDNIDEERLMSFYNATASKNDIHFDSLEEMKIKVATARCARVSYMNYEGTDDYEKDFRLFKQLKDSRHMSPFEHCAKAMSVEEYESHVNGIYNSPEYCMGQFMNHGYMDAEARGWCNNFKGFIQSRYYIEQNQ